MLRRAYRMQMLRMPRVARKDELKHTRRPRRHIRGEGREYEQIAIFADQGHAGAEKAGARLLRTNRKNHHQPNRMALA